MLNLLEFRYTKFTLVDVFVCDVRFGSTFATAFEVEPTISSPEIVSISVLVLLETVTVGVTGVDKLLDSKIAFTLMQSAKCKLISLSCTLVPYFPWGSNVSPSNKVSFALPERLFVECVM